MTYQSAPAGENHQVVPRQAAPQVEAGRLHEVMGDFGINGLGVMLGWLADGGVKAAGRTVWIGRAAWPSSTAVEWSGLLSDTLLINAGSASERAWASELCVRCEAVAAVVADGRGFDLTMTRRLQLAVRGMNCRLIVLRPHGEAGSSAAGSRWVVRPIPVPANADTGDPPRWPRWRVELVKRKGGHQVSDGSAADGGAERLAGLRTAGEMFCNESDAPNNGDDRRKNDNRWTFEWDPHDGRGKPTGLPVDPPADVASGSMPAPMAWTG